jgi:hypothetical protein
MQAFGEGALRLRGGMRVEGEGREARAVWMRTAAWLFVWCLLAHGGDAPAYSQTDSVGIPQRVSRGNPFRVRIVGTTNTQAVLTYSAPDSGACTVKVSQQSSLTPLVHDVDPNLFPGSDQDTRPESITAQNSRIFVAGKRVTERTADGNNYSRALEAYAIHYYRVACGNAVATGTFTTANIPFGMTYQDLPQLDPSSPGNGMIPTISNTVRGQRIIDSHTGAAMYLATLPADTNYTPGNPGTYGPFMYFGGSTRVCTNGPVGPDNGFLCSYSSGAGGYGVLYYIIPSTPPVVRYLGSTTNPYPYINPVDGKFYSGTSHVIVQSYNGSWQAVSYPTSASFSSTTLISDLGAAVHAFDATFDPTYFSCSIRPAVGDLASIACSRGTQDSYGWAAAVKLSTGQIVAATPVFNNPKTTWCGLHALFTIYDGALGISTHQPGGDGTIGQGPYITTYAGGSTLLHPATSITVAGEPSCSACGVDLALPVAQIGDTMKFATGESVTITGKADSTHWTITATTADHAPGEVLTAQCSYAPITWDYVNDPHGTDTTNTYFAHDTMWPDSGGHDDATWAHSTYDGQYYMMESQWSIRGPATMANQVNHAMTHTVNDSPLFAGKLAQCSGNGCTSHPSASGPGQPYLTDFFAFAGAFADSHTWTWVAGQLYKRVTYSGYGPILPKHFATVGSMNNRNMIDVSPATIGTTTDDTYKFCISNSSGECYAGSAVGDVYANIPITTCGDATGSSTVYTCPTAYPTATAYTSPYVSPYNGLYVRFVPQVTNTTGTATLNVSGLGAQHIFSNQSGGPVAIGSLVGGSPVYLYYYINPYNSALNGFIPYVSPTCGVGPGIPCLLSYGAYASDVVQVKLDGSGVRALSGGLSNGWYVANNYPTAKSLGDGSYTLFGTGNYTDSPPQRLFLAKLPTMTASDAVDRTTFVRAPIPITTPVGLGIATAAIEFGYAEQGTPSKHYCTSRREVCVAVSSTVNDAAPFYYAQTDTYTHMPCAKSCTITLPVLPAHVTYYQVRFYDAQGVLVGSGDRGVSVEATAVEPRGVPANANQ